MKKFLFILITLFILAVSLWSYLHTPHSQKLIASFITKTIKEKTGYDVEIEGFSFSPPFYVIAKNVQVQKDAQNIMSFGQISISIPYWQWANKAFIINHISFVDVHIAQLPKSYSKKNEQNVSWKSFPYNIKLPEIQITHLTIDPLLIPIYGFDNETKVDKNFMENGIDINGNFTFDSQSACIEASAYLYASSNSLLKNEAIPSTLFHFSCQGKESLIYRLDVESKKGLLTLPYDIFLTIEGKNTADHIYDGHFDFKTNFPSTPTPEKFLTGDFFYSPNGQLDIHSIQGHLDKFSITGEVSLNTTSLDIQKSDLNLEILDCAYFKNCFPWPIEGSLKASVAISGTLIQPFIDLKIRADQLKIHEEQLENILVETTLSKNLSGLEGQASLCLDCRQIPLKANSDFLWDDTQMGLTAVQASYGKTQFSGDVKFDRAKKIFEGKLTALIEDKPIFKNLLNINLNGSEVLALEFYGMNPYGENPPVQYVNFSMEAKKIQFNTFSLEIAKLSGVAKDIFNQPHAEITLEAKNATYQDWKINECIAQTVLDHSMEHWPFKIITNDSNENDFSVIANGHWRMKPNQLDIKLESLQGQIKKYPYQLQAPIRLNIQNDIFDLSPLSLNVGDGNIYTTIDYKTDEAYTTTNLKQVPLEIFYPPKLKIPFTGTLSGEVFLFGSHGQLAGQMQAQLNQIKILDDAFAHTPPFEIAVEGAINQSHVKCSAQVVGVTEKPIEVKAELPIHVSLNPPTIHIDQKSPLYAHIEAEGDIVPLLQLFVIETSSLSGKTSVALNVTGTFDDPHVSGDITLVNGTFESPNTGAVYHHLNAHLEAHDKILVLKKFNAVDLSDGLLQGDGVLELKREHNFPFTLNLQLSRIRLLNLDFVKAIASGHVVVTGSSRHGSMKGYLTTDSVQATIPEQVPALAHALDITYINIPYNESPPIPTTSIPRWPLEFDLQIDVEKNATISSKNLSSYWQGGVKVKGMSHNPQLFGDFKISKGEYRFNGQTFDIKEGTISFAGEPDKKTTLYVIASKDLGRIVAEVILKGPVKNPLIAFRSNPPMSQREIISRLLFGQGTTDITPFQGAELSQSISNLMKSQGEPSMLSKIRDKIGIDRIDISKTEGKESNEVSVQVGKYISQGVLVKINKSITSEANQVGIEANLLPNIKAEAQVGDDSSAEIQLKWKRDY